MMGFNSGFKGLLGDDDKNGQEHGSCTEINKCRVAKHEITVRSSLSVSSLSVSDARCQLEEVKVQMCVPQRRGDTFKKMRR